MKVLTLCTISRDGKRHPAGAEIELPDATAEGLLARIPPAVARVAAVESTPPRGLDVRASVRVLVPLIKDADAPALVALRVEELAREDGPRATVLAAIDERLDALGPSGPAAGDADDADDDEDDETDEELDG